MPRKSTAKTARNEAIFRYHLANPGETGRDMAEIFGVTRQRIWFILKRENAARKRPLK